MSGVITAGQITSIRSLKDRTVRVQVDLQELDASRLATLFSFIDAFSKIYISNENISEDEIEVIDAESLDNESKTPSQRLRNVLYRYWEQDKKGYEDFNLYYRFMMSQISEAYKNKLD